MAYTITRKIEIDAGHRILNHESKCKNIHGHRYTIEATCIGENLVEEGSSTDMLIDFAFLKDEMVKVIDAYCDHALILSKDDEMLSLLVPHHDFSLDIFDDVDDFSLVSSKFGKIYVIQGSPTAEVLAEHWYQRLETRVALRSNGFARLKYIKVYETPNCWAVYPSD